MRKNPFDGKGKYTKFVWRVYEMLMSRQWFSLADVMAKHLGLTSADELPYSISKCESYGELKKAFRDVRALTIEKAGKDCIETSGNNRSKEFRYVGSVDNPLEDLRNAKAISDIRTYAQFCADSAGFFPLVWLDHFLEDSLDLLKIKQRKSDGSQIISSSVDRELKNLEMLPLFYEAIRDKQVLSIKYQPYGKEAEERILHPHLLKEYNGRWFIFGHVEGRYPEFGYNLALDRVAGEPCAVEHEYKPAPKDFYEEYFRNIVGVTHTEGVEPERIIIRAVSQKIFKLVETKRIHSSQHTILDFAQHDDGEYGLFSVEVEINNEFIGRVLQLGDGLVVISPPSVREKFSERISQMADLYKD